MSPSRSLPAAAFLAHSLLVACSTDTRPDVVIVTIDTLRHDAVDDPVFQGLAERGSSFTQAATPLPRTTPALASMHTGLVPERHRSLEVGSKMDGEARTLAQHFSDAGYQTLAVSGSSVAGPKQGLDRGFESFTLLEDPRGIEAAEAALGLLPGWRPAFMEQPVFLWVHMTDPHFPYLPEDPPEAPLCQELGERAHRKDIARSEVFSDLGGVSSAALDDCRLLYAAEASASARGLAALLEAMDDPIVVVTSDHGENMGEAGLWYEHGPSIHDASMRVPLILAGPGVPVTPGGDERLAMLQDVMPTLLGLAGLDDPGDLDGIDLFGDETRPYQLALSASALHPRLSGFLRAGRGHKRNCTHVAPWALCTDGLFHQLDDPLHQRDLSDSRPDVVGELEVVAARWPAESARQWAVRTAALKGLGIPEPEGYDHRFVRVGAEDLVDDAESVRLGETEAAGLREVLLEVTRRRVRPDGIEDVDEEALRALGYVE